MDDVVLSVRFLLDANSVSVGDAVAKALVCGQPPRWQAAGGLPTPQQPRGLRLPPVSEEWAAHATKLPSQLLSEKTAREQAHVLERSFSLGLRPLAGGDKICAHPQLPGYRVSLEAGATSTVVASELPVGLPGQSVSLVQRHFRTGVSSAHIAAAAAGVALGGGAAPMGGNDLEPNAWIGLQCVVRPCSGGRRTELERQLLGDSALVTTASSSPRNPATRILGQVSFMLEVETRAWLECLGFSLAEVWRHTSCAQDWAASGNLLTVGSYIFCVGHAAASPEERRRGPLFDAEVAAQLSEELPKDPRTQNADALGTQFIEGNVDVRSFAALLDRVCRRADEKADIFRRFVDLGSGHGLAVLTAHLLFPFRDCTGCELNPEAAASAEQLVKQYETSGLACLASSRVEAKKLLIEGDFLKDLEWCDASVVYANCVCWPKELIYDVGKRALRLQRGAVLLLAARQLPTEQALLEAFDVRGEACLMSFASEAICFWVYKRR